MTHQNQQDRPRLGFIGLGLMGLPMTLRLLELGYELVVSGREPERVQIALEHGAMYAGSPSQAAEQSDFVHLCVTDADAVEDVIFSENGVANSGTPTKLLVDHSTTEVGRTRTMGRRIAELCGMGWVDAPISGGPAAARRGELAIMCGGSEENVARAEPVLRALGRNLTHMGATGAGQVTKMVNQVIAGVTFATLAEALKMAENAGIDAARIPECLAGGYADSTMLQGIYPRMAARDFNPPSGLAKQMLKDLRMVAALASETNTKLPMADQARLLYEALVARGLGDADTSAIVNLYD